MKSRRLFTLLTLLGVFACSGAALALDPRHEESLYNLGNCLVELGEPAAALTRFGREG